MKKFKIPNQQKFPNHRHGWDDVVASLQSLHNSNGILLDTTIDVKIAHEFNRYKNELPTKESWVGFSHLTPLKPPKNRYFDFKNLGDVFTNDSFIRDLLSQCRGLFVLSQYVKNYLSTLNIPISVVYHPTQLDVLKFDIKNYNKCIVHCGFFLRKFHSFVKLKTKYTKKFLFPGHLTQLATDIATDDIMTHCDKNEIDMFYNNIDKLNNLSHKEYDYLLANNLIFVDFYDSSANNTIIECIARNNPIIVNKNPAVVEYLGVDYPLYFDSLEEASEKINSKNIFDAYEYLLNKDKTFLTYEYFLDSIINSTIYKNL